MGPYIYTGTRSWLVGKWWILYFSECCQGPPLRPFHIWTIWGRNVACCLVEEPYFRLLYHVGRGYWMPLLRVLTTRLQGIIQFVPSVLLVYYANYYPMTQWSLAPGLYHVVVMGFTTPILHIPMNKTFCQVDRLLCHHTKMGVISARGDSNTSIYLPIQEDNTMYAHYTLNIG